MAQLSILDSVNVMLSTISAAPVNTLDSPVTRTTALAVQVLDETRQDVLSAGYTFNKDFKKPFVPDATTGEIVLPSNILRIDTNREKHTSDDFVERRGKLYDRKNRTSVFTQTIYCDVTEDMQIEDMPQIARLFIAKSAARVFAERYHNEVRQDLRSDEDKAKLRLLSHESDVNNANMFRDNVSVGRIVARRTHRRF